MSDDYPVPRWGRGMSARWITADVFDGLAQLDDGSVDLVVTSPPFLALRSYLPADHPDKAKEIGSEATPAEFIDTLLAVTAELRRVLAPHGSICVELGDTYSGAGGENNLYTSGFSGGQYLNPDDVKQYPGQGIKRQSDGWPLAKSRTCIPQLYEIALAYGINPLTGSESPAGQWRIRNVVTWARPNPPVGALGDKWRPATSDVVVAGVSDKRYWDDLATRKPHQDERSLDRVWNHKKNHSPNDGRAGEDGFWVASGVQVNQAGAPLLDYWEIPPGGYKGAHYAVFPPALVVPLVKAMCPQKVCRSCGEPSRRIVGEATYVDRLGRVSESPPTINRGGEYKKGEPNVCWGETRQVDTLGWTDCDHDDYRPGVVLDPFAGSGTTLAVATGHGHAAIGIDLDPRNEELARDRIGPFLFEVLM